MTKEGFLDSLEAQFDAMKTQFNPGVDAGGLLAGTSARATVPEARCLRHEPGDSEAEHLGYDIERRDPRSGRLRFIEVKGRVAGADTITVMKNEILTSLNKPEDFILAIVEFLDGGGHRVHYVRRPFRREPDFGVSSVNYDVAELLARAGAPA